MQIKVISKQGKGKAFIVLHEEGASVAEADAIIATLEQKVMVLHLTCPTITDTNWQELSSRLATVALEQEVRVFSLLTFGAASVLAQVTALSAPRMIRTLVLVDPTIRAHPTASMKVFDVIESYLPLGLPFRSTLKGFDGKSLLHRLRCPTLLAVTKEANEFTRQQALEMADMMPTAWHFDFASGATHQDALEKFCEHALQFMDVPARFPQKNIAAVR